MKTKMIGGIAVLATAAVAAFTVNFNSQKSSLSDLFMTNAEVLAQTILVGEPCVYVKEHCCRYIWPDGGEDILLGIPLSEFRELQKNGGQQ
ncbi:hypothetical protein FACS189426_22500 [Bacteroidia bacterium]|nr:hypothetical protein FACS189426_22500 [Bacteroidia bacterium]GHT83916.1 hypothetical protein FACS18947_0510 [Bacteroidia bacterium]